MNPVLAMLLVSCLAAAGFASAIFARDPGQRANRLLAMVLGCSAYWSLCEIVWNTHSDPNTVIWLIRLSAFGWIPLGPLVLDLFVEVTGSVRSRYRRIVPTAYALAGLTIAIYVATPWCIRAPIRVAWGWSYEFGPLFPIAVVPTLLYVVGVLILWPELMAREISPGEKRQVHWMFFGILVPTIVASLTDILLPYQGIHVPRLGSTSILAVGAIVTWSVRRYGYFLLAPGAFTQEILAALRDGVALLRADGRIRSCNDALPRLIGTTAESLREWPVAEFLPDAGFDPTRETVDFETDLVSAKEGSIPVSVSSSPLRDDKGEVIGSVIAVRDLREVMTLRSRLVTSGRLAAVGELAAGIAHEIDNPITFVRANLVALQKDWKTLAEVADDGEGAIRTPTGRAGGAPNGRRERFDEGDEILTESVEGVDRIASIVRDVGAISHAGMGSFEFVELNSLLDNAVNVAALSRSVSIERFYSDIPQVRCAPQQLKQVFLNLLINAFQATGDDGGIRLTTAGGDDRVEVRVEDDGCGIPDENLDRIFDPFFTTQPVGEGTGLGLALCYQIVHNHGGEIRVESVVGEGTSFRVLLPIDATKP